MSLQEWHREVVALVWCKVLVSQDLRLVHWLDGRLPVQWRCCGSSGEVSFSDVALYRRSGIETRECPLEVWFRGRELS